MERFGDQFDNDHFRRFWWAQDGAPPHTLVMVRNLLVGMFQDRVIALHHDPEWLARSPDLTPCDFFLWGLHEKQGFLYPTCNCRSVKGTHPAGVR